MSDKSIVYSQKHNTMKLFKWLKRIFSRKVVVINKVELYDDHIHPTVINRKEYDILERITFQDVRNAIDELGYSSRIDKEKKIVILTFSEKGANVELVIHIVIDENWLKMYSYADIPNTDIHLGSGNIPGIEKDDDDLSLFKKINEYNRTTRYANAYLENGVLFIERNNYADSPKNEDEDEGNLPILPVSKDYLLKNLDAFITVSAHFFNKYLFDNSSEIGTQRTQIEN